MNHGNCTLVITTVATNAEMGCKRLCLEQQGIQIFRLALGTNVQTRK
jgi:hypothetical protein